jgi:hypothetical protein
MTETEKLRERAARAVSALREPDASLARVPNTIRQSIADVIEELTRPAPAGMREALEPFAYLGEALGPDVGESAVLLAATNGVCITTKHLREAAAAFRALSAPSAPEPLPQRVTATLVEGMDYRPKPSPDALREAALAVAIAQGCGLTFDGQRTLCTDPRASPDIRADECSCQLSAQAVLAALASPPTPAAPDALREALATIQQRANRSRNGYDQTGYLDALLAIDATATAALASSSSNWVMVTKENPLPLDLKIGDLVRREDTIDEVEPEDEFCRYYFDDYWQPDAAIIAYRRSGES